MDDSPPLRAYANVTAGTTCYRICARTSTSSPTPPSGHRTSSTTATCGWSRKCAGGYDDTEFAATMSFAVEDVFVSAVFALSVRCCAIIGKGLCARPTL